MSDSAMIITCTIEKGQKPTEAQLEEVRKASKQPITFDKENF
jgi:hypothetical protein